MKGVQCYEFFGGIALKNHTFIYLLNDNGDGAHMTSFEIECQTEKMKMKNENV